MDIKEHFDRVAQTWDKTVKHDIKKINKIFNMIMIKEGKRILDVGTGTGVLIPYLISYTGKHGKIDAIDLSENMIKIAKSKYKHPNVTFIEGDITEYRLEQDFYDYIICYSVYPHFAEKGAVITTLYKLLKKGGKLVICHTQSRDNINKLHKDIFKDDNVSLPPATNLANALKKLGMRITAKRDNKEIYVVIAKKQL